MAFACGLARDFEVAEWAWCSKLRHGEVMSPGLAQSAPVLTSLS